MFAFNKGDTVSPEFNLITNLCLLTSCFNTGTIHFSMYKKESIVQSFVQYANLFFASPSDPKEGKNETGENSKGVLVGRRGSRKENSPCEVEDYLLQQGQGRLGC